MSSLKRHSGVVLGIVLLTTLATVLFFVLRTGVAAGKHRAASNRAASNRAGNHRAEKVTAGKRFTGVVLGMVLVTMLATALFFVPRTGVAAANHREEMVTAVSWEILCRAPGADLTSWVSSAMPADQLRAALAISAEGQRTTAVRALYRHLLNRDPIPGDCPGLRSWVDNERTVGAIQKLISDSDEAQRQDVEPDTVSDIYMSVLCRRPDPHGVETWAAAGVPSAQLRATLAISEEGQLVTSIRDVYSYLVGRDPFSGDCTGLHAWVSSGRSIEDIRDLVSYDREYTAAYGDPIHVLTAFDAGMGQRPLGLAAGEDALYASFANTGQVVKINPDDGSFRVVAQLPPIALGMGYLTGIAADRNGFLYVAQVSFNPASPTGIYRVHARSGNYSLFASHHDMTFPNALKFDANGDLYVSDSLAGAIFRISPGGVLIKWKESPLLMGDKEYCGAEEVPLDVGANGLAFDSHGALFVANMTKPSVIKISVSGDRSPGVPKLLVAPNCGNLRGANGLVIDGDDNVYVSSFLTNALLRITPDGEMVTIDVGGPLHTVGDLTLGVGGDSSILHIAAGAGALGTSVAETTPQPAILRKQLP